MKAIVATYLNGGIGCDGKMQHNIPEDMNFFRKKTKGKVVVMGRKTFESFPGKSPLKNRINVVLTKNKSYKDDRVVICNSIDETLEELKKHEENDIFIIGGEAIYRQFLPFCSEIYVTKIRYNYPADKFFPNLDDDINWKITKTSKDKEDKGIQFNFVTYKNINYKKNS